MANDAAPSDTLTLPEAVEGVGDTDCEVVDQDIDGDVPPDPPERRPRAWHSALRRPATLGVAIVVVLSTLLGWLGFQYHQASHAQAERGRFLQTARQAALNLTTIDWEHAEDDVRRITEGATGEFYDEFAQRSDAFVGVVKQAKSVSVGTVTEAGLESQSDGEAQALVAVSVKTSNTTGNEQVPRAWRMRISVQRTGDQMKVSRVEFVP
ncbi:mammalian cell entry protein [Mycobacterium sp. AT1]|uniref:mammalian cell entry protein n=1 Tax=Mycobacterium sp. AT1 TaxID=1961706 RepID=UPI001154F3C8|nr:mammalian cell entry protein [Mycobacterium sp. AT1]